MLPLQSGPGNDSNKIVLLIPQTPAFLEPHHQIVLCHKQNIRLGNRLPQQRSSQCILQLKPSGPSLCLYGCMFDFRFYFKSKVGDLRQGWPLDSFFDSYYTKLLRRDLHLSLDCSTLPLIGALLCWVLSKEPSSNIFRVFGKTRPGIEPRSPGPIANTLTITLMSSTFFLHSKYLSLSLFQSVSISVGVFLTFLFLWVSVHVCLCDNNLMLRVLRDA